MKTLSALMGKRFPEIPCSPDLNRPHPHTSVGIEVELEGLPQDMEDGKRWRIHRGEGSLINGLELISDPVWGTGITDAIEELQEMIAPHDAQATRRGSVHVHVNMLDMEMDRLSNLIQLYAVYERPLFRLHDHWDRKNNPFCFPLYSSINFQKAISTLLFHLQRESGIGSVYVRTKYTAMNPNNLSTLGTLEFRHMGATTSVREIDRWINILLQLKAAAIVGANPAIPSEVWGAYLPELDIRPEDLEAGLEVKNALDLWR